jgi:sugar O-acyltransferase (sialic acid O-acetyltransferase NeuD family)
MDKIVIIGYSGHAFVVIDAAEKGGLQVNFYAEKVKQPQNSFELNYIGFEEDKDFEGWENDYEYILGVGDNKIRERVTELILSKEESLRSVIHPSARIGAKVDIGDGTFIAAGAVINPLAAIGTSVIINTGAIVEHECKIGEFAHIAPGAVLAGNVKVGKRSFVGANATIKEGVEIGRDVIIGAGTVVLNDVQNGSKIVGNPGRVI